jgi:hypothetical protein
LLDKTASFIRRNSRILIGSPDLKELSKSNPEATAMLLEILAGN